MGFGNSYYTQNSTGSGKLVAIVAREAGMGEAPWEPPQHWGGIGYLQNRGQGPDVASAF